MKKPKKKCAPTPVYVSPKQLSLDCFKTPFEQQLNFKNRWVILATLIPWDEVCNLHLRHVGDSDTGRPPPLLARIYNPHRQYRDILISGMVLPESEYGMNAVSRGDDHTRCITLRNLSWNSVIYNNQA